jgi:hypothetical protein
LGGVWWAALVGGGGGVGGGGWFGFAGPGSMTIWAEAERAAAVDASARGPSLRRSRRFIGGSLYFRRSEGSHISESGR